ncbi:MAG: hypothetical protein KC729_20375, partial [Candidatus Eisenbacteria bacterium]|nr:hypothetical protein [Candidatus Eisenbacteria bacterium]
VLSLESVQEGSLMTDACPNNFTNLVFTDSTATYSHVLLCGGVSLDGPGVLSTWRFHANAPGTTVVDLVSNPDRTFFDDGIFITPAHPTDPRQVYLFDATVTVGTSAGIGDGDPPLVDGVHVRVIPNPVRDRAALHLQAPSSAAPGPVAIEIVDTGGRRVAGWTWDSIPSTEIRVAWDATDRSGRPLPAGAYFYVARVDGQTARGKIQIVR